ncbi:MAG: hypothetical protein NT077_01950, partial [Candidatus Taylorbacteria bacterium]|nr:hypothetical protein [Candidatus Taylorbacteria bacterium]
PVAPAVTGTVSVTASPTTVNSGGVVTLTFTYPSNLLGSAKLVINCPDKVWIPDTNGSNLCGLYQEMRDSRTFTFAVMNTSGSVQRVTPNYVVYTSDNPNLANIKSAVISVNPAPTSVLPPLQSETLGASIFDAIQEFIRMR